MKSRAWKLAERVRRQVEGIPGARVLDRGRERSAIVTVSITGREARDLVQRLREQRINTAATLAWFGLLDLGPRGVTSALRISPHYYNTEEEIDLMVNSLGELSH